MARQDHWLRLNETLSNPDGEPTDRAIAELVRGFEHTRQETKRQRILVAAAAVLALAAGVATWQAVEATRAKLIAEAQRDRAERAFDQVVATANRRVQSFSERTQKQRAAPTSVLTPPQAAVDKVRGAPLDRALDRASYGDTLLKSDDVSAAKAALLAALDILEASATAQVNAKDWQLLRLKVLHRLADAYEKERDTTAAIAALTKSLAITEAQAAAEPDVAIWRQAQGSIAQRLASFALKVGDVAAAERHLESAAATWRSLAQNDANRTLAQRELAFAISRLGDLEVGRARITAALKRYHESLELLKSLAASESKNTERQSDLSAIYQSIADAHLKAGRPDMALLWAKADVAVATYIANTLVDDPVRGRDLASSYDRLARSLQALGRNVEALEAYGTASNLFDRAIIKKPNESAWQRDAAALLENWGKLLGETAHPDDAFRAFRRALSIREGLAASSEEQAWRREVEAAYRRTSETMLALGRTTDAYETAEQYLLSTSLMTDNDESRAERIGRALGTLAWSALHARNFERAEWAGKQAVILAPNLSWLRLNYAHALMLSGKREKARELYKRGLSQSEAETKNWRDSMAKDFAFLRSRKLDDPLMEEVLVKDGP
jgi:tetratricopeptide (TPR) repeat protein